MRDSYAMKRSTGPGQVTPLTQSTKRATSGSLTPSAYASPDLRTRSASTAASPLPRGRTTKALPQVPNYTSVSGVTVRPSKSVSSSGGVSSYLSKSRIGRPTSGRKSDSSPLDLSDLRPRSGSGGGVMVRFLSDYCLIPPPSSLVPFTPCPSSRALGLPPYISTSPSTTVFENCPVIGSGDGTPVSTIVLSWPFESSLPAQNVTALRDTPNLDVPPVCARFSCAKDEIRPTVQHLDTLGLVSYAKMKFPLDWREFAVFINNHLHKKNIRLDFSGPPPGDSDLPEPGLHPLGLVASRWTPISPMTRNSKTCLSDPSPCPRRLSRMANREPTSTCPARRSSWPTLNVRRTFRGRVGTPGVVILV
ncbi:hypothetical protein NMY22_g20276 [Coprinellus aureogranulatus]|nr:hypothetical protein NMY22_g20276 [Coprinellus aureogranulatus]